jgi:transposase-like protein
MDKEKRTTSARYSAEVRARAARMVLEHTGEHGSQWAAIGAIAPKIGCMAETLRGWVRQTERDQAYGQAQQARGANGSRRWSGRTANCAKPTT